MRLFRILVSACLIVMLTACTTYPVISKRDCVRLSEDALRIRLLEITPKGTPVAVLTVFIEREMKRKFRVLEMQHYGPKMRPDFPNYGRATEADTVVRSSIAWYGWAQNLYSSGNVVTVEWLINSQGRVEDLRVDRWTDGM